MKTRLAPLLALLLLACGDAGDAHHGHAGGSGNGPEGGLDLYWELPGFSLRSQDDVPFGKGDLQGAVHVSDFVFTTCPDFCPLLSRAMQQLQTELEADPTLAGVRLVSFSVDPETDTPEALRRYGGAYGADFARWRFVTGPRPDLVALVQQGFKLPVMENPEATGTPFLHSDRFVLTDSQARIRGFYPVLGEGGLARLLEDLRTLVDEEGRP